jgi:sugar phosphate permease
VTAIAIAVFYRDLSPRVRGQILQTQLASTPVNERQVLDAYADGRAVYRSPRLWLLSTVIVFWSLTYVTVSGYVPTFLTQHHHLEPAKAAGVTSYFWFVFTISVFVSGWISDITRVRKTVTAFGGVMTGVCLIVGATQPVDTSIERLSAIWSLTGFFAGFIYPAWCAIYSETAESVSPHGVGRAFGITATLAPIAGLVLNLGLPRVVAGYGWDAWMLVAAGCCFCVSAFVSFGKGPWWIPSSEPAAAQLADSTSG